MKSLLIERVQNGWIVRPFTPGRCDWEQGDQTKMYVFTSLAYLTEALPQLLTGQWPKTETAEPAPGFPPHPCSVSPQTANQPPEPWPNPPREFP